MRIVIDMQGAQTSSRLRGIGRYSMALAQAMVRNRGEHEIILLLNCMFPETIAPIQQAFADLLPRKNIRTWHALAPVAMDVADNQQRRHIAQAIREDVIHRLQPDVLHITSLFEGFGDNAVHSIKAYEKSPLVAATFYDLIPLIQKDVYLDPNPRFKKSYGERIEHLKRADLLLAISSSSRQEAIDHLAFEEGKVVNISAAADDCFQPLALDQDAREALKRRLGIRGSFLMYSGATDDRKNHRGLIEAYSLLPASVRETYQLVLAGGLPLGHRQKFEGYVRQFRLNKADVILTGRVSDEDLIGLYSICDLYVFPSWHEGFGLPVLEAMSCGAPVIGSNNTSVPEVIGFERALFDPYSPQSIADKIQEVLNNQTLHAELKAHALIQAAQFSWEASARRSIKALEALYENTQRAGAPPHVEPTEHDGLHHHVLEILKRDKQKIDLLRLSQIMARNVQLDRPQLLVDVSELVQRDSRSGIQRVVRSILKEWLSYSSEKFDVRLVYANDTELGYRYAASFAKSFLSPDGQLAAQASEDDAQIDFYCGDHFFALDMQHEVQIFQQPFYQRMRERGVTLQFLVHDLLPVTMPAFFPESAVENHEAWLRVALAADTVICISQATAQALRAWMAVQAPDARKPDVGVFHLGADIQSSLPSMGMPEDAALTLEQLSQRPTFLMVGTLEPRKGHVQALDAMEVLWQAQCDVNLVLVGKLGWHMEELAQRLHDHPERNQRLLWLDGISDEYLTQMYQHADCLLVASVGEGFGLPLIEAARHRLPIIARDLPVLREVAGEHAYYFHATDGGQLAQALRHWLSLYEAKAHPGSAHMPWFSWQQSAQDLFELVQGNPPPHLTTRVSRPALYRQCLPQEESTP